MTFFPQSLWRDTVPRVVSSPLHENIDIEVCVIGAGIAGLSTAYHLSKNNTPVVVIDSGVLESGVTADTTAHLTWRLDSDYTKLCKIFGEDTKLIAQSHRESIKLIEKIVYDEQIDCNFEFVSGYLIGTKEKSENSLFEELKLIHSYGFTEVEKISTTPNPNIDAISVLHFPLQAQFHPLRYINGLCQSIQSRGAKIFTSTKVTEMHSGSTITIHTENGNTITCKKLVVATNTPINNLFKIHTKQAPYQSYVVAMRVPRYSYQYALYWDDQDPYHYVRFASATDYDLVVVGGEDHKTGQEDDSGKRFAQLRAWTKARFPKATDVEFQWCGQVMEPVDQIAFIGKNPGEENVFIATGFSGNGMTYGTIAGQLISDMVTGESNPYIKIYSPSRISLHAFGEFAKENLNVASQFKSWVAPGEKPSPKEISRSEGAIVRDGVNVLAVYKDENGQDHCMSAKCPHLGCVVHWNSAVKTWDCPCHGSRFSKFGAVINGPAVQNLTTIEDEESIPLRSLSNSNSRSIG